VRAPNRAQTTFEWVGDARSQEQEALACSQNTVPELRQKDELLERNISRIKLGFPKSASPDYCLPLAELQSLSVMRDKTIITMAHGTELEISDPSVVFRLLLTAPAATPMDVHIVEPALANDDPERGAKRRKREDGGEDRVRPLLPAPSASSHVAGPRKTNCSQFFGKREIVMTVSPSDALCGEMATSQLSQMSHCDSQLEAGAAPAANGGGGAPLPDFPSQATPSSQTSSVTVNSALISQRDDDFSWSQTQ
jgi:hypothetical protein